MISSTPRQRWRRALPFLLLPALAASPRPAAAQQAPAPVRSAAPAGGGAAATPQRPSLSFNASTVPAGRFEVEMGGLLVDGGASVPAFLKYGLADRLELEAGFDAIRTVETGAGDSVSSAGDLTLGLRGRSAVSAGGRAVALAGWVKLPTAVEATGSGETDVGLAGIVSLPLGRCILDANLWLAAIGQADGALLGQVQGVATLGLPGTGRFAPFVEAAWQRTARLGDGAFLDAGIAYTPTPRAVFDAALGVGFSDGYPDWMATIGWTVLTGR